MRRITCRAVSAGKRARISAATPLTTGAAKLVPDTSHPSGCTRSPVAATSTQGPARVNGEGTPSAFTEPTVST